VKFCYCGHPGIPGWWQATRLGSTGKFLTAPMAVPVIKANGFDPVTP
jgi:hypothetical protein